MTNSFAGLLDDPAPSAPSARELATRAAVDIALIDARMTKLTYPDPNRPILEYRCHPGAKIIAVRR